MLVNTMAANWSESQGEVRQLIEQILTVRRMTRKDQAHLMSLLFDGSSSDEDLALINKLFEALLKRTIEVVD